MSNPNIAAESMVWIEKLQAHQPAWLFITLFALLCMYAWIRVYYGSILMQTIQASVRFQVAARMFADNSILQKQLDSVLYVLYFLSGSLIFYMAEIRFGLEPYSISGGYLYLFNLVLLVLLFLARVFLINMTGFLFNRIRIYREYLYNIFLFNKLIGLIILPLLLFVIYTEGILSDVFQWITIVAFLGVLAMRLVRGLVFSFKKDVSIFYMFLYLCALEIVPLVLLYRWLEDVL